MDVNFVGLASSAASHKLADKGGQTRPPIVMLNQMNGAEISAMSSRQGAVQGVYQILASWFRNVQMAFEIQGTVHEYPVIARHARKEGSLL